MEALADELDSHLINGEEEVAGSAALRFGLHVPAPMDGNPLGLLNRVLLADGHSELVEAVRGLLETAFKTVLTP